MHSSVDFESLLCRNVRWPANENAEPWASLGVLSVSYLRKPTIYVSLGAALTAHMVPFSRGIY